jgi:hypothetical protein
MTTKQPIGAYASVMWTHPDGTPEDGAEYSNVYFSFGDYDFDTDEDHDSFGVRDDRIFFYCDGEQALKSYMTAGMEDFVVTDYELEYKND